LISLAVLYRDHDAQNHGRMNGLWISLMRKVAAALELVPRLLNRTSHELDRFLVEVTMLKCQKNIPVYLASWQGR